MSYPTIFNNLPGSPSTNPASLLDTMFNITGAMGAIPCTATGTNAITLTPNTNYYLPAAYANYQIVSFVAAADASGVVTIRLGALSFVKLYMPSGLQANSGDININVFYIAAFNGALDSGNGGFQVFNASTPSVIQPVVSSFNKLIITNGGSPDTQVSVAANQIMLGTSGGGTARVTAVNVSISTATNGANGLDAGTVAAATWYFIYVIFNGTTTAGLLSLSSSSPTLPSGYTYFGRVGSISTGAASTNLTRILQYGRDVQYTVVTGSQTATLPAVATAVPAGGWSTYSVSAFVPTTAAKIKLQTVFGTGLINNNAGGIVVAPNNNYSAALASPYGFGFQVASTANLAMTINIYNLVEFVLESSNIYATCAGTAITLNNIYCLGWTENI